MAFVPTATLIATLRDRLQGLRRTPAVDAEPIFQKVGVYGGTELDKAMRETFVSDARVCFIVPGADRFTNRRDRSLLQSQLNTGLALIIADQNLSGDKEAAVMGGTDTLGILAMKDAVIADLFANPFTDGDLCYAPISGEPIVISHEQKDANALGREAYLLWLEAYAGEDRLSIA